jgi:DNA gyrase inhibitor GyrI
MFGYSPMQARQKLNIVNEFECIMLEEPDVVELNGFQIQCISETGRYFESAPRAWDKLRLQLTAAELSDDFPGLFIGIGHDNPHEGSVDEDKVRFSAGISFAERDLAIERFNIASGKYARFRYVGKAWKLGLAYHYIYGKWSETSSYNINITIPAFTVFDRFPYPAREEHILIYVPILQADVNI